MREFCSKSITQDICGLIFPDKYYEEKKKETKAISLCLGACAAHCKAKIWFMSRSLWSPSLQNLDGVFAVFYIRDKWDKCSRLKKTELQEYLKLITRYEVILNRKSDAARKISNIEPVESIAKLLELVMIQ